MRRVAADWGAHAALASVFACILVVSDSAIGAALPKLVRVNISNGIGATQSGKFTRHRDTPTLDVDTPAALNANDALHVREMLAARKPSTRSVRATPSFTPLISLTPGITDHQPQFDHAPQFDKFCVELHR